MELKRYACRNCGAPKLKEDGSIITCTACGSKFKAEAETKKIIEEMRTLADEIKQERVANLRRQLYERVNAEYINSEAILQICQDLRSFLPDDFLARFFEVANGGTIREYAEFINRIDQEENYPLIESVVKFTARSLTRELILPLNNLIERTYKLNDIQKYRDLQTLAEEEAERVSDGVYDITVPRDAFIIYSSKDMDKVMELVSVLEDQGLSCFVALRNLQHGRGATANYQKSLETAIEYAKCVVFVSSKNSRSASCDACRIELPYIRAKDIQNAPREYRQNYTMIPMQYKKPRVEYMIEMPTVFTAADRTVKEFFSGLEYCYTPDDVADRIYAFDSEIIPEENNTADLFKQFEAMMAEKNAREMSEAEALRAQIEELKRQQAEELRRKEEEIKRQQEESRRQIEEAQRQSSAQPGVIDRNTLAEMLRQIEEEKEEQQKLKEKRKEAATALIRAAQLLTIDKKESELREITERYRQQGFEISDGLLKKYVGSDKKVIIPDVVTHIGRYAFLDCKTVESVVIPEGVTRIGTEVFVGCSALKSVNIPDGVTEIPACTFVNCEALQGVVIPDSVISIGSQAFFGCTKLTEITIPHRVTSIGEQVFGNCTALSRITVDIKNKKFLSIDGNLYSKEDERLIRYSIGKIDTEFNIPSGVPAIAPFALDDATYLKNISLPISIRTIGRDAFSHCESLQRITIPNGVARLEGGVFSNCKSLKSITLPRSIETIYDYAFGWCESLTSIILPDGVKYIRESAFAGCHTLESVTIPSSVKDIGSQAFSYCSSLKTIIYEGSDADWDRISKGKNWDGGFKITIDTKNRRDEAQRAIDEARRREEAEARRKAAAEAEARRKAAAEAEAKRKAEEEARRKAEEKRRLEETLASYGKVVATLYTSKSPFSPADGCTYVMRIGNAASLNIVSTKNTETRKIGVPAGTYTVSLDVYGYDDPGCAKSPTWSSERITIRVIPNRTTFIDIHPGKFLNAPKMSVR